MIIEIRNSLFMSISRLFLKVSKVEIPYNMSFRQKPECSYFKQFWPPHFAGVTLQGTIYEIIKSKVILKGMGIRFRFIISYDAKYESAVQWKAPFDPLRAGDSPRMDAGEPAFFC
jgi:hypothetical protein